jgi:3-oxoacyl-(acyl-carrier-protein) synthase
MDAPLRPDGPYARAVDPDYKQYFAPNVARRLGKLLKRALLTSRRVMEETGVTCPGAIITGTGLGCIENTGIFLNALVREGEELLKPTYFMQSTHNTISSLVAIDARCHGYNSTYAHKGISFECALLDAFLQLREGRVETALVGAHDEMTPDYFVLLKRAGYLGHAGGFSGETAASMMLADRPGAGALCRLSGVELLYRPGEEGLRRALDRLSREAGVGLDEVDAVMTGANGHPRDDQAYGETCPRLFPGKPLLRYKHLFGESYTAPALGVYAAATCLHRQRVPAHLCAGEDGVERRGVKHLLCYHHFENKTHSLVLLSACGG